MKLKILFRFLVVLVFLFSLWLFYQDMTESNYVGLSPDNIEGKYKQVSCSLDYTSGDCSCPLGDLADVDNCPDSSEAQCVSSWCGVLSSKSCSCKFDRVYSDGTPHLSYSYLFDKILTDCPSDKILQCTNSNCVVQGLRDPMASSDIPKTANLHFLAQFSNL